ncbi:unnamed protein product [Absidia cylindrospora]
MNNVYPMTETPMWLRETVYKFSRAARSNMNLALAVLQHYQSMNPPPPPPPEQYQPWLPSFYTTYSEI